MTATPVGGVNGGPVSADGASTMAAPCPAPETRPAPPTAAQRRLTVALFVAAIVGGLSCGTTGDWAANAESGAVVGASAGVVVLAGLTAAAWWMEGR